jgi:hypothetical protein
MTLGIESLAEELAFFKQINSDLLKTNRNQFALIKGHELINSFTTLKEAYEAGVQRFQDTPFLVKQILDQERPEQLPALSLLNASL